ncbi:hypothetical protein [Actinocorallia herbida]|uniref:hypothetical protein n=1 Tax=Actinocorallia herbida TaxID=58109 RepID=UPI000F4CB66B|nr:hypothetical protein [Actinocorallia herbida]
MWADNDPRSVGRTLRIERVEGERAVCSILTNADGSPSDRRGTTTRIGLRRFVPTSTGYRFLHEPPPIHEKACPDAEDHSEHEWDDAFGDTFYCPGEWL